jgi:hypothetical protein
MIGRQSLALTVTVWRPTGRWFLAEVAGIAVVAAFTAELLSCLAPLPLRVWGGG